MTRIIKSIPRGVFSGVVANYAALPGPATVPNKYYWVTASQGTAWLPGSLGGTYYPNGVYYSNGSSWEHVDTAFQASQADVDAGTIEDQFVSPKTLKNAAQWTTKISHSLATGVSDFLISSGAGVFVKKTLAEAKVILGISNVDNTSDVNKPVSTAQAAADANVLSTAEAFASAGDASTLAAANSYADTLVVGLLDDRGNYNPSTGGNAYPSAGGSGSGGSVKKGDLWTISGLGPGVIVAIGTKTVSDGDAIRALSDVPGQTDASWNITENNFGYTAENAANKDTDGTLAANSDTNYPSQKAVKTYADTKLAGSSFSGLTKITVGTVAPVAPSAGDLWIDTN